MRLLTKELTCVHVYGSILFESTGHQFQWDFVAAEG